LVNGGIDLHSHGDSVEYVQAEGLKVTSKEDVPMEIDGELWGRSTMVEFSHTGKTLKVFTPIEPKVKLRYALLKILSPWRH
jgi:diacylglycerol kinase family enzyme